MEAEPSADAPPVYAAAVVPSTMLPEEPHRCFVAAAADEGGPLSTTDVALHPSGGDEPLTWRPVRYIAGCSTV